MYSIKLKEITQVEAYVPEQETVPFSFLGRTWLKPKDHDLELRMVYGSWKSGSVVVVPRYPLPPRIRRLPYPHFDGRWRRGSAEDSSTPQ